MPVVMCSLFVEFMLYNNGFKRFTLNPFAHKCHKGQTYVNTVKRNLTLNWAPLTSTMTLTLNKNGFCTHSRFSVGDVANALWKQGFVVLCGSTKFILANTYSSKKTMKFCHNRM